MSYFRHPKRKNEYTAFISRFDLVGSGGLYTTVEDLFLWDQNFYHGKVGGKEVIETVKHGWKSYWKINNVHR